MMVMGERAKITEKKHGISSAEIKNPAHMGGRLDLNDLRKRAKEEENENKKNTVLIVSGCVALAAVLLLIFTL